MKMLKHLAAAVVTISLLSSCSVIKNVASSALSMGSNTGSAITSLYQVLKTAGNIDLSSITNLINLGQILSGANSVSKGNTSFLEQFATGLINGSSGMITNSNATGVINGLKALAGLDTSAISRAATSAAATGAVPQLSSSTPGVSQTLSQLNGIFNLLQ